MIKFNYAVTKFDFVVMKLSHAVIKFNYAVTKFDFAVMKFNHAVMKFDLAVMKFDFVVMNSVRPCRNGSRSPVPSPKQCLRQKTSP